MDLKFKTTDTIELAGGYTTGAGCVDIVKIIIDALNNKVIVEVLIHKNNVECTKHRANPPDNARAAKGIIRKTYSYECDDDTLITDLTDWAKTQVKGEFSTSSDYA